MYILVRKAALELLIELLRRRPGMADDELLQEILVEMLPKRKEPQSETKLERKQNGRRRA